MQFSYLFLVLTVAAVASELININDDIDELLIDINDRFRSLNLTSVQIPPGSFGVNVTYSDSEMLGFDSMKRTDNCTSEFVDENVSRFDLHFGFGLLQQSFKIINILGQEMSGGYRVRNNSVYLSFTINRKSEVCYVTLHDLRCERLADVDFYSSRAEYDGANVEVYFKNVIIPFLNSKVDKDTIERQMQILCFPGLLEVSEYMPLIHKFVLEQIGVPSQL